ncbi:MAG: DUF664 domain-containing protein [Pseudonocardiaceae bacterium]
MPINSPTGWVYDRREVTLHQILVHVIAETHRHAGHADIIRELIDGAVGPRDGNDNMAPGDQAWWKDYHSRLKRVAHQAGRGWPALLPSCGGGSRLFHSGERTGTRTLEKRECLASVIHRDLKWSLMVGVLIREKCL